MTRPFDWMPLAETDPLPGDPDAITLESGRLVRLGDDMRTQAARLRQIGADTSLVGAYAEELRSASGDLAQDLDKVAGRYERVASALKDWAPELAVAQAETLKARTKALEAEQLRQANSDGPAWGAPWSHLPLTPTAGRPALDEASQLFADAQRVLQSALEHAAVRGRHYANLIDEANDIFKDGRWDNFKDWADRNADCIDDWSNALGWVATAAAVGAIFIPGANVLALGYLATALSTTAIAATGAAAVGHLTLASTGNGSWIDVGLDVFALVTLGVGLHATRGVIRAQQAMRIAAAAEAERATVEAVVRSNRASIHAAERVLQRATSSEAAKATARETLESIYDDAAEVGARAAQQIGAAPLPETKLLQRAVIGDREMAGHWNDIRALGSRFTSSPTVAEVAELGERAYRVGQTSYAAATVVDLASKAPDVYAGGRYAFTKIASAW